MFNVPQLFCFNKTIIMNITRKIMKLESLISEVNIVCVKLKNGTFLFQEYAFSLRDTTPSSKFCSANFGSSLIPFFLLPTPF